MFAAYSAHPLSIVATAAADDLSRIYADRTANTDAVKELEQRFRRAVLPLTPPSESQATISALRLATRGGTDAPQEAMKQFATDMADRLRTAYMARPPEDEYRMLIGFCLRVVDAEPAAQRRSSAEPVRQPAVVLRVV